MEGRNWSGMGDVGFSNGNFGAELPWKLPKGLVIMKNFRERKLKN